MTRTQLIVGALLALCVAPVIGGVARLAELAGDVPVTGENARFLAAPVSIGVHIVAALVYAVLGAFQFVPSLRTRKSGWHRRAGQLLAAAGFAVALTGLSMTLTYPWAEGDGAAVYLLRLVFGSAMLASLVLALVKVVQRDFVRHGEWMTRAYAIGMGAGTQALTHIPLFLMMGKPEGLGRTLAMAAGWVINLAIAQWVIRRDRARAYPRAGARRIELAAASIGS